MEENNIIEEKYIDSNGVVWTPLFDKDGIKLLKTAEECYLDNEKTKLSPQVQPISLEERITQLEVLQVNIMSMQIENKLL